MNRKIIKTMLFIFAVIITIQLIRIGIERMIFLFVNRNTFTYDMVTMATMLILTVVIVFIAKKFKISMSIFPQKFSMLYIIETLIFTFLIIFTPIITGDKSRDTIMIMIYSSLVTPLFEELIFRGYIWNKLNAVIKREWAIYCLSSILFALWHLGYIDGIAFHTTNGLLAIMGWKVIVGFCYGLVLGAIRLKTKNCYSTILLHGIMNIFGR